MHLMRHGRNFPERYLFSSEEFDNKKAISQYALTDL